MLGRIGENRGECFGDFRLIELASQNGQLSGAQGAAEVGKGLCKLGGRFRWSEGLDGEKKLLGFEVFHELTFEHLTCRLAVGFHGPAGEVSLKSSVVGIPVVCVKWSISKLGGQSDHGGSGIFVVAKGVGQCETNTSMIGRSILRDG